MTRAFRIHAPANLLGKPQSTTRGRVVSLLLAIALAFSLLPAGTAVAADAAMTANLNFSTTTPASGQTFDMNINFNSQSLGDASFVKNARVEFDLPAKLDVVALPTAANGEYTVTTSGDTHVVVAYNQPIPVGALQRLGFSLKWEAGTTVQGVDTWAANVTVTGTDCTPGSAGGTVNPTNIAKPVVLSVDDYLNGQPSGASLSHSSTIHLTPEAELGGLNETNAQVQISIPAAAIIEGITLNGTAITPTPSAADPKVYTIPVGTLQVGHSQTIVVTYHFPPDTTNGNGPDTYNWDVTYSADRAGSAITPEVVNLVEKDDYDVVIAPVVPAAFKKSASAQAIRAAGRTLSYVVEFWPTEAMSNIVVVDNPLLNEADFFNVNRFTQVSWQDYDTLGDPSLVHRTKTRVSYHLSDEAAGTWHAVTTDPALNGSTAVGALPTGNSSYVDQFKFEFYYDQNGSGSGGSYVDGGTGSANANIPAQAGHVRIQLNAVMLAESAQQTVPGTYDYIPEVGGRAYLENTIKVTQGTAGGKDLSQASNNEVLSSTELRSSAVRGYLAQQSWSQDGGFWWAQPAVESSLVGDGWGYTRIWHGSYGGRSLGSASAVAGDELWAIQEFTVTDLALNNGEFYFIVPSADIDVIDAASRYGAGPIEWETFTLPTAVGSTYPAGSTIVRIRLLTSPFEPPNDVGGTSWGAWQSWQPWAGTHIGIKLKVKPGATSTPIIMLFGTPDLAQDFGNGSDLTAYGWGWPAAGWPPYSNVMAAAGLPGGSSGEWHVFYTHAMTLPIDNTIGLNPEVTTSADGITYGSAAVVDNTTAAQDAYYKLHAENSSSGGYGAFDRVKIISNLPVAGADTMTVNNAQKGSTLGLDTITIDSITITDGLGVVTNVSPTNTADDIKIYYTMAASWQNNRTTLSNVTAAVAGTWVETTDGTIPAGAEAIMIDLEGGLPAGSQIDIVYKGQLPQSTARDYAYASMAVGAHYAGGNVAVGEPAKAGVRGSAGMYEISGLAWFDLNHDGIRQSSESSRCANVAVELYDDTGTLLDSATTASDGSYSFIGLENGTYVLKLTPPAGLFLSPTDAGTNDTVDNDYAMFAGLAQTSRTINGANRTNVDAGFYDNSASTLSVSKVLAGNDTSNTDSFDFVLKIGGTAASGESYSIGGTSYTTGTDGSFSLKGGETADFTLPVGTSYEVTEAASSTGYSLSSATNATGTLPVNGVTATFTNTRDHGTLTVKKLIAGNGASSSQSFTFTLSRGGTAVATRPYVLKSVNPLTSVVTTVSTTLTTDASGHFSLTANQLAEFALPTGPTYTVTENDYSASAYTTTDDVGTTTDRTAALTIGATPQTATFTNTRNVGVLQVTKQVQGSNGETTRSFDFTLMSGTLSSALTAKAQPYVLSGAGINTPQNLVTTAAGAFSLADGQTATFTDIPVDWFYEVTEDDYSADLYVTTSSGDTGSLSSTTATATAAFVNRRLEGAFSVTKELQGQFADTARDFDFRAELVPVGGTSGVPVSFVGTYTVSGAGISGTDARYTADGNFTLRGGQTAVFDGLLQGTYYSVTETAVAGYVTTSTDTSGTITDGVVAPIEFTNTREEGTLTVTNAFSDARGEGTTKVFRYTILVDGMPWNGSYAYYAADGSLISPAVYVGTTALPVAGSFTLKHGEKAVFKLPTGVTYLVTQDDYSSEEIATTWTSNDGTVTADHAVAFSNVRLAAVVTPPDTTPPKDLPTGKTTPRVVKVDNLPTGEVAWVWLLVVAAVAAVGVWTVTVTRKNRRSSPGDIS